MKQAWRIWLGLAAGVAFGLLDVIPMMFTDMPQAAAAGAFASRFAIGFLIPQVMLPLPAWLRGLIVALLISTPDAIITGSYIPIYTTGALGGILIGALVGWLERRRARTLEPAP